MKGDIIRILIVFMLSLSLLRASDILASANLNSMDVPGDFPTIQQALDAAEPGEEIRVAAGTYEEHITVRKSIMLRGEGPGHAIIDGKGTGNVVTVEAESVEVSGFTIRNGSYGVYVGDSTACMLRNNNIEDNRWNLAVWGDEMEHYIHDIDSTNLVGGRPVYYWINQNERRVPTDAGFVAAINCTKITVENLDLTPNEQGVLFVNTTGSTIRKVTANGSDLGIYLSESHNNLLAENIIDFVSFQGILLQYSHNNTIVGNTLRNGILGIGLLASNGNTIYHNDFINNEVQLGSYGSSNLWDNGQEGNYWSDYSGVDLDGDGIGDTSLPHLAVDYYPLTRPRNTQIDKLLPWQIFALLGVVIILMFALAVLFRRLSGRKRSHERRQQSSTLSTPYP